MHVFTASSSGNRRRRPHSAVWALALLFGVIASQPTFCQADVDEQLRTAIEPLVRQHRGEIGLAIRHLGGDAHYEFNADTPMPTASLIKLPVLITAYRMVDVGELDLSEPIRLTADDKVPGSGVLTPHFSNDISLPLLDYIRLMIRYSDNTATNIIANRIGLRKTSDEMAGLGLSNTKLHSLVYRGETTIFPDRSKQFGLGSTTANEMVQLLCQVESGKLASPGSTEAIREHLLACDDSTKIAAGLAPKTKFAHKTGAVANCRTDAGLIYTSQGPVAVCFLSNRNEDQSWSDSNEANVLAADIGRAILARFGTAPGDSRLAEGAFGRLVESLQRTLNQRLDPSPNLAIDGDFGPATRAAVERFQRSQKFEVTGVVEQATWDALGTLIEDDDPVPAPEIVNSQQLPVDPQPASADPPIVTARAWAVADPSTGDILSAYNSNQALEAASTTKIMTAYLIVRHAEQHPEVLDEVVTFSERADNTVGSTASLRAGERVLVRDLLYGLLLPSGNDAGVALAEHLGARMLPEEVAEASETGGDSAYDRFVRAMNVSASKLGLQQAHYVNPHGLPHQDHVISASDLIRLSTAAMRSDLFARIVSTRQFGCTVEGPGGYRRNVLWKNTNNLLKIEGYSGIKTGTTSAAGACLVAMGEREGHQLIAVVLGCSSSPARYADARNLFQWAWRTKPKGE